MAFTPGAFTGTTAATQGFSSIGTPISIPGTAFTAGQRFTALGLDAAIGANLLGGFSASRRSKQVAGAQKRAAAIESQRVARDRKRRLSFIRAQVGAGGSTFEGNPTDILAEQAAVAEQDRLNTSFRGDIQSADTITRGQNALFGGIGKATGVLGAGVRTGHPLSLFSGS